MDSYYRSNKVVERIILVGAPVLLIALWQILGDAGVINGIIVPTPLRIVQCFISQFASGKLVRDIGASIYRVLMGFFAGSIAGLVLGILCGLNKKINSVFAVVFGVLRPIPMIGMVPLMILWFGIGETSKIIVIAIGTFWSVSMNTQSGIANVSGRLFEVARLLKKSKLVVLTQIVIPSAIPSIFTGLRLGISMAWKTVLAAEMLGATKGIGHLIEYARELAQPDKMFVGLLSIGLIGLLVDSIILAIQKKLIYWQ